MEKAFIYPNTTLVVSPVNSVEEMSEACKSWIHPDIMNVTFFEKESKEVLFAYATGTKEEIIGQVAASGYKMAHPAYMLGYIKRNPEYINSGTFALTTFHPANIFENKLGNSGMYGDCVMDFRNNKVQFQTSDKPEDYALCLLKVAGHLMGWHLLVEKA